MKPNEKVGKSSSGTGAGSPEKKQTRAKAPARALVKVLGAGTLKDAIKYAAMEKQPLDDFITEAVSHWGWHHQIRQEQRESKGASPANRDTVKPALFDVSLPGFPWFVATSEAAMVRYVCQIVLNNMETLVNTVLPKIKSAERAINFASALDLAERYMNGREGKAPMLALFPMRESLDDSTLLIWICYTLHDERELISRAAIPAADGAGCAADLAEMLAAGEAVYAHLDGSGRVLDKDKVGTKTLRQQAVELRLRYWREEAFSGYRSSSATQARRGTRPVAARKLAA